MISWKYSLELVSRELDLTRKKRDALNDLLVVGRISQSTYEYLEKELAEAVLDFEAHQKSLVDKMTVRADALEKQIKSLELFLANLEVHHAAGEIDEETYTPQIQAIALGLEATRKELDNIRSSLMRVVSAPKKVSEVTIAKSAEATVPEPIPGNVAPPLVGSESIQETPEQGVTTEQTEPTPSVPEAPSTVTPEEQPFSEGKCENP